MKLFRAPHSEETTSDERGFVLLVVMVIIALLFPAVIAFNSRTQISLLQAANFRDTIQALRLARSGVDGAIGLLQIDDASYDAESDKWAMQFPSLAVGDGMLTVKIIDEDRKININRLVKDSGKTVDPIVYGHLQRLITRLGGKQEVVDALVDWMDIDSETRGSGGAEEDYYKELEHTCKNGPVDSLDELFLVRGFDKDLLVDKGLKEYITVAPTDGRLNVNTADIAVLYDIHVSLREGLVEEIVRARNEGEFKQPTDVKNAIGLTDALFAQINPLIKVNSSVFLVKSRYAVGNVSKTVEATLARVGTKVSILSWREF
jgi:general secretion pathway protein K